MDTNNYPTSYQEKLKLLTTLSSGEQQLGITSSGYFWSISDHVSPLVALQKINRLRWPPSRSSLNRQWTKLLVYICHQLIEFLAPFHQTTLPEKPIT